MDNVLAVLLLVTGLAAVMGGFAWLARLVRRRGLAGTAIREAMAAYEEGWHVSGYDLHQQQRAQADRAAPIPAPANPDGEAASRRGSDDSRPSA